MQDQIKLTDPAVTLEMTAEEDDDAAIDWNKALTDPFLYNH